MTETTRPARTNRYGEPCPPWCKTDHSEKFHDTCVGGGGGIGHIWARAVRAPGGAGEVSVDAALPDVHASWPHLPLDLRSAEHLAVVIDMLADATPEQHRELAEAIRQAAAQVTEARDG